QHRPCREAQAYYRDLFGRCVRREAGSLGFPALSIRNPHECFWSACKSSISTTFNAGFFMSGVYVALTWLPGGSGVACSGLEQQSAQQQIQCCQPLCQASIAVLSLRNPECGFGQTAVNQGSQGVGIGLFNPALIHQHLNQAFHGPYTILMRFG